MEEEKKENLNSQNEDDVNDDINDDFSEEEKLEDENSDLSDEEKIKALEEKNKQLFQRAKKAELKNKEDRNRKENIPDKKDIPSEIDDILSLQADGYSAKEIKTFKEYSKKMGISVGEVKDDPFIRGGIEAEREKEKVESATPPSSDGVSLSKEQKEFKKMNRDDREKNWDKKMDGYKSRRLK